MAASTTSKQRVQHAIWLGVGLALVGVCFALGLRGAMVAIGVDGGRVAWVVRRVLLVVAAGGFGCGAAIALVASSLAVEPLGALTRSARAMRRDLDTRTRVAGQDAIGQLGAALDELADSLASEHRSLEGDRNRLVAILESMAEGVLVTGEAGPNEGLIVLANASLREMLLVDRSVVGMPPMEAIRVSGLDEILARANKSDEPVAGEIEVDGIRPRRLLVRAARLRAPRNSKPAPTKPGLVAVFNDVTELRRLESIRRDFVANVSHELRTPIAAISSAAETLQGGALGDPTMAQEFVAIIGRHSTRLRQLVEDLLELSRLESKEWRMTLRAVDLAHAARGTFDAVAVAAKERGSTLSTDIDAAAPRAVADPRALEQVLVNLVENALKYAGARAKVRLQARRDGDRVTIAVIDNGPGIEPKHLPRLFERFYRVDAGRSRAVGGTGLGLAIVKHLVEAMRGTVVVESTLGVGTTFRVSLPCAKDDAIVVDTPSRPADAEVA